MSHFAEGLCFYLPDAFPGDFELAADFFKGPTVTIYEAKSLFEYLPFPFGQSVQHVANLLPQQDNCGHLARILSAFVFDEIAETRIFTITYRRLQRDRLLRHLQHGAHAFPRVLDLLSPLFWCVV